MFYKSSFFVNIVVINFCQVSRVQISLMFRTSGFKTAVYTILNASIYIGETSRSFKTRCSEHKRDLNPRNLAKIDDNNINKKTALVKHVVNFQHNIDFDNSSILAFESDFFKHRFLESFFINNKITTVNDKENCFYNEIYNELK